MFWRDFAGYSFQRREYAGLCACIISAWGCGLPQQSLKTPSFFPLLNLSNLFSGNLYFKISTQVERILRRLQQKDPTQISSSLSSKTWVQVGVFKARIFVADGRLVTAQTGRLLTHSGRRNIHRARLPYLPHRLTHQDVEIGRKCCPIARTSFDIYAAAPTPYGAVQLIARERPFCGDEPPTVTHPSRSPNGSPNPTVV